MAELRWFLHLGIAKTERSDQSSILWFHGVEIWKRWFYCFFVFFFFYQRQARNVYINGKKEHNKSPLKPLESPKDKYRIIVEWCVKTESDSITPVLVHRTPWPTAGIILTAPATGNVTDESVFGFPTSFSHPINRLLKFYWINYKAFWPVIVSIAESSNWDGEWLPYRVQCVLDHLCFVADGEPANKITEIRPLERVAPL